jgi:type IV pilus assembly protein PilO
VARSFSDLSGRSQLLIFVALCAMTVAGAWQLLVGPALADLANRQARLVALQGEVSRAQATAARLPAFERDIKALETSLRETTAVLPDEKDPQDVLRNLHELASETALDISSFTPKAIVTRAQYAEWPIELGLEGGYHDLGRFFDRVATMSRLMSVADLHIKVAPKPTAKTTIAATCVATTFVFKKEISTPAAPRPAGNAVASSELPAGGLQ